MALTTFNTIQSGINYSFETFAEHPFLEVNESIYSYKEFGILCNQLAKVINSSTHKDNQLVGVLGYRSVNNYVGIYGSLVSGYGYLPLNPKHPINRLIKTIQIADVKQLILCKEATQTFKKIANHISDATIICLDETEDCIELQSEFNQHQFIFPSNFKDYANNKIKKATPNDLAYVIFTSGSTGIPKGVMVSQSNVCAYSYYCVSHYNVSTMDKFSQAPDVSFDLSVHDLFVSILGGASLCVVPEKAKMAPAKFIIDKKITFWTSVPSVAMFMAKMRMLKPNAFPSVRCSMFCGEALPQKSAEMWQAAMPNALVENTYGPTEATVAVTNYKWDNQKSPNECENGIVPLGKPFPHQNILLLNDDLKPVKKGEIGEICLAGPQVTLGYFKDKQKTEEKYITIHGYDNTTWYRTGDLGKINPSNDILYYLGRVDNQVKIRGYRVELQEIDRVLKAVCNTDLAISVPIKNTADGNYTKVIGYIENKEDQLLREAIMKACKNQLPEYMVPAEIIFIDEMPVNANGKIDRKKLLTIYGE